MKIEKISEVKSKFSFEGILKPAIIRSGKKYKLEDYTRRVDLLDMLAPVPERCYLVTVTGESMINLGIFEGDILVVDKYETPADGKIVIASVNGELTVKTYRIENGEVFLEAANEKYPPIRFASMDEVVVQGVVRHVIHSLG